MDALDQKIINDLQRGFPVCEQPFKVVAKQLGCTEQDLITRISTMLESGLLTRFGPLYNAQKLGGALSLCAMQIPEEEFDAVALKVNEFHQVAHNYERDHAMNMWFVLATETSEELEQTLEAIEKSTTFPVYNFPKEEEFFVELHFQV